MTIRPNWFRRGMMTIALAATFAAATASAHHSFAMYDANNPVVLRGRVTAFRWVSPHATFSITTETNPGTAPAVWVIELSSPANMGRLGWTQSTLAIGDHVAVYASPLRDGTHGGACRQVRFLDKDGMLECGAGTAIRAGEKPN
jgi:hypothetical protein